MIAEIDENHIVERGGRLAERNKALDGLRGLAALSVVFYHAILHHKPIVDNVLQRPIQELDTFRFIVIKVALSVVHGDSAVLLFFVLSGFVLTKSLDKDPRLVPFVVRRLLRLYPAMFAVMALMYIISLLSSAHSLGILHPNGNAFLLNALLIKITVHGPSTTIQAELLAMPFIYIVYVLSRRFGSAFCIIGLGLSVFAMGLPILVFWLPNMHIWLLAFMLGMVAADRNMAPFFRGTPNGTIATIALLFVVVRAFAPNSAASTVIGQSILAMAIVGCCYYSNGTIVQILSRRGLQFLGRLSYSIYLIHVPALFIVWYFIPHTHPWYSAYPLETGLLVGCFAMALALPTAWLVEQFIERPGIALGRRLTAQPQPHTSAAREDHILIECYLSGQISPSQWNDHLRDSPVLRQAWEKLGANRHG